MPIDSKLLEILVCPVTKQPLGLMSAEELKQVNEFIARGGVCNSAGEKLNKDLENALITANRTLIYPLENNIPLLIETRSIACAQFPDWQ